MVLNASISRVLGQRPTFYCPLFVLCFVFWLGRVRISILQCNQCTMFIRKNKIIIIILQAVDGATVVAMGHRCSNRSQHFLSLSTGRWCHRYGNGPSPRDGLSRVGYFIPLNSRPLNGHPPSLYYNYLKSVCRRSQTAGRNSCSIGSGDVSNCSVRLTVHPVTSSRHSSGYHAPMKSKRIRGNSLHWLDGEISQLIRQSDRAHNIAKRSGLQNNWDVYKKLRNSVTEQIRCKKS